MVGNVLVSCLFVVCRVVIIIGLLIFDGKQSVFV